jgi:DnaJ-class molecular chaperone
MGRYLGNWQICPHCEGDGHHAKSLGVINMEDADEEFREDYFAGRYDRTCEICNGSGKVREGEAIDRMSALAQQKEDLKFAAKEDGRYNPADWD